MRERDRERENKAPGRAIGQEGNLSHRFEAGQWCQQGGEHLEAEVVMLCCGCPAISHS